MKKEKTILRKVMTLLGMEVKLEQMKLADGVTVIQADAFEPEMEVMIVTADEQMIPLPVGEYELEDGRKLMVAVDGVIASVEMVKEEEEIIEPVETPIEASTETTTPSATKEPKSIIESTTREVRFSADEIDSIVAERDELKSKVSALELKLEEVSVKPISFNPEKQNKVEIDLSKSNSKTRITNELNNLIK